MPGRDGTGPIRQGSENVWKGKGMVYGRGCCRMSAESSDIECLERRKRHLGRPLEAVIMQLDATMKRQIW